MANLNNDISRPMRRGQVHQSNEWSEEGNMQKPSDDTNGANTSSSPSKPVPGRPRRRKPLTTSLPTVKKKKQKAGFWKRFHARWIDGYSPLIIAVLLWYLLGVVSIGTSKLLLMDSHHHGHIGNVPPLYLTLQQLFLGTNLLRYLLRMRAFGSLGMQPFPSNPPTTTSHRSRKSKPRYAHTYSMHVHLDLKHNLFMLFMFVCIAVRFGNHLEPT